MVGLTCGDVLEPLSMVQMDFCDRQNLPRDSFFMRTFGSYMKHSHRQAADIFDVSA